MRREEYAVGHWLSRKLMQECGLVSRQPGRRRYRGIREESPASANLLKLLALERDTMKRKLLLSGLIFSLASTAALASPETESQVALAKTELAEAFIKGGLLTDSFTEKARNNPQAAGQEIASSMAKNIDSLVVQGINNGESCEEISKRLSQGMAKAMAQSQEEHPISQAAKKAADKVPAAAAKYAHAECVYLTE